MESTASESIGATPWRVARVGLALLVPIALAYVALSIVVERLMAARDWQALGTLNPVHYGLFATRLAALVLVSRAPRISRIGPLALGAVAMLVVSFVAHRGFERWLYTGTFSYGAKTKVIFALVGLAFAALEGGARLLVLLAVARARRSAGVRVPGAVLLVVVLVVCVDILFGVGSSLVSFSSLDAERVARTWVEGAADVAEACLFAWAALALGRATTAPVDARTVPPAASADAIPREWRRARDALGVYLGGAAVRIMLAGLTWAVMQSANGATSLGELSGVRDLVVTLAIISGLTTLVMIVAVIRFAGAPDERVQRNGMLAAVAFVLGLLIDGGSTAVTAAALGGDLSAAFFAMDALPVLGAVAGAVGAGGGAAFASSIGAAADAIGDAPSAEHARTARWTILGAGSLLVIALLFLKPLGTAALVPAVLALPLACAALVRFVQAAMGLRASIHARAPDDPSPAS